MLPYVFLRRCGSEAVFTLKREHKLFVHSADVLENHTHTFILTPACSWIVCVCVCVCVCDVSAVTSCLAVQREMVDGSSSFCFSTCVLWSTMKLSGECFQTHMPKKSVNTHICVFTHFKSGAGRWSAAELTANPSQSQHSSSVSLYFLLSGLLFWFN